MDENIIQIQQSRYMGNDVNVIVPVSKTPEQVVIQFDSSNKSVNRSVMSLVIRLAGHVCYPSHKVVPYKHNATIIENGFVEDVSVGKKAEVPIADPVSAPTCQFGESNGLKANGDDEVLRLIKRSEFNIVEQFLQMLSKISVLSLLMNSEVHREALQKVLEQAYMEHDATVDQFDHIVANITSCNNMSFCDEELPEEGRNHNLALHISMNCKEDALSNVLVDTGSSLNVLLKSTLARLSYPCAPMSCLLGRPLIHEAGSVTSTLHQKLKFVKNGKLFVVGGEKALLMSHLSSFTYVEAEKEVGTLFQTLSIVDELQKTREPMSSLKDAKEVIQQGPFNGNVKAMKGVFRSGGFIHGDEQYSAAIIEDNDEDEACANFVTHGQTCNNWVTVNVHVVLHPEEENDDEEMSDELSRLLEHEEKTIHLEEQVELVNLGSDDDVKEVKIGSQLCPEAKKGLVDLL
ncbi:hypothetical protein KIW84_064401 [Lathyrus oleraceus]|uniref:Uncharacterized protein n=1 Tax=Pisum sativum TaxID=3888 RepID=A0A9D4WA45_PEA|nr:hypothetical protein KIW84_064401 [Pisum sativum]